MAQALVPLKDLVQAKTRLAGLLRPSERRALAQAMVEDVLAVLAHHSQLERVTLVSDDPGAGLLAGKYGIDCWTEESLGCRGLNAVVRCASTKLLADSDSPLLVLHGDLPLLSAEDIDAVIDCQHRLHGLVIASDLHGTGTNLLAFDRSSVPRFHFGAQSCSRHQAAAREAGVPVCVLRRPGIATDVDEPQDFTAVLAGLERGDESHTARLLCGTGLGVRITMALTTLDDNQETGREEAGQ